MHLGIVAGTLVASRKEPSLEGLKLLVVRRIDPTDGSPTGESVVAVDAVGAGVDDAVLYASGSSARQTELTDGRPCDAVIMAIVDSWEIEGETRYRKTPAEGPWAS